MPWKGRLPNPSGTMMHTIGGPAALALAALVLIVGRFATSRVAFLARYSIPHAVTGGLIAAILMLLLRLGGIEVTFERAQQPYLMLAFFASIGLGADVRVVARGGKALLLFLACVAAVLVLQNVVGIAVAIATGQNPLLGLVAGSVAMSGGHGTAAAWGARFESDFGMTGAVGIGLAAATFGLVAGGLLGGPVGSKLVERLRAEGKPLGEQHHDGPRDGAAAAGPLTADRVIVTLFLVCAAIAIGLVLAQWTANPKFTLPSFVWVLVVGVVLRNVLSALRIHEIDQEALDFVGAVSLSLYLATALMSLRLWELASLAVPMFLILAAQIALMYLFVTQVTWRVMGRNYDAALLSAAQCGFGLGATPTAMANMEALARRYGYSVQAFIVAPIIGAFLIDLCNALVISAFAQFLAK
jgi:ESS family glutamate:Na+ symporter